jgi:hypothetical protein
MDDVTPLRLLAGTSPASAPVLLQPSDAIRYRVAGGGRGDNSAPQYSSGAAIDYILPPGFTGPLSLEIRNAAGQEVRTVASAVPPGRGRGRSGAPDDQGMRGSGRGRGGVSTLSIRAGHNRFVWDYRWANAGPMVAPGKYAVQLRAGAGPVSSPLTFEVKVDPRLAADGLTVADLVAQEKFLLEVRGAQAQANQLRASLQQAMTNAGVRPSPAPGPGEWPASVTHAHPLQALWARLVTAPGTYEQGMLIDQLSNILRAEGGADQKVGEEARKRFADLLNELKAIEEDVRRAGL